MENTETQDNFNTWLDIVKKHHPNLEITDELMDILFDTFSAGMISKVLDTSLNSDNKSIYARLH